MNMHHSLALARKPDAAELGQTRWDADEMIERVVELRPWLRNMQAEAERQRRVPQETSREARPDGRLRPRHAPRVSAALTSRPGTCSASMKRSAGAAGPRPGRSGRRRAATCGARAFAQEVVRPVYDAPWVGNRTCAFGAAARAAWPGPRGAWTAAG